MHEVLRDHGDDGESAVGEHDREERRDHRGLALAHDQLMAERPARPLSFEETVGNSSNEASISTSTFST